MRRQQSDEEKIGQKLIDAKQSKPAVSETISGPEIHRKNSCPIMPVPGLNDPDTTSSMLDITQEACHNLTAQFRKDSFEYSGAVSSFSPASKSTIPAEMLHNQAKSSVEIEAERILNAKYIAPPSSTHTEAKYTHLGLLKQLFPNQKDEVSKERDHLV